jgi:impB/mucB/samB family
VYIPSFPIAVAAQPAAEAGEHDLRPLALVVGRGNRARVRMADEAALEAGVRPGLHTVARARACVADLRVQAWDDDLYDRAQEDLAARLLEHTPAVTRAGLGRFWFDAAGQERLGGEEALTHRLHQTTVEAGYTTARVTVAGSVVAAEAAGRLPGEPVSIIPPGAASGGDAGVDAEFLAFLPLELLPLDPDLHEVLKTMGLQTVGELAALPATSLELRFGAAGLAAWDLARGIDPRGPLTCGGPSARLVELALEPPAQTLDALVFGARAALVTLLRTLKAQGSQVARLRLHFKLDGVHASTSREAGLSRPTTRLGPLVEICRAVLERLTLPAPVVALGVEVIEKVQAVRGEQGALFQSRFRDPEALEAALSRIRARCGTDSVARPLPVDDHRRESQGTWVAEGLTLLDAPPAPPPLPEPAVRAALPTALRLLETPEGVRVRESDGVPMSVQLDRRWHTLATASPVRRLSGGWWNDTGHLRRDHLVTTTGGARLLLSRPEISPGDAPTIGWTLIGWED